MTSTLRPLLTWRTAAVTDVVVETATARSVVFDIPSWGGARAGQHVDIRLTAPDGYQATRSYSLSSGPDEPPQITVERVDNGEVSPFLVEVLEVGDTIEIRGPLGGYFVYEPDASPLLLIGGGSGIAPLRSMWRAAPGGRVTILYSARTHDRVIYRDELAALDPSMVKIHLTREQRDGFEVGRIDSAVLAAVVDTDESLSTYVCGPTEFVESVIETLQPLISIHSMIRAERFG